MLCMKDLICISNRMKINMEALLVGQGEMGNPSQMTPFFRLMRVLNSFLLKHIHV